jgi:hypothetical protein
MKLQYLLHFPKLFRRELILIAVASLLVWVTVVSVPWNMDEFLPYHALACREPAQQLNSFRESCFAYATNLGPFHFFRSYQYVGVASSILFAPFYTLANSIWMHYLVGACALAATAWGLKSSFGLTPLMVPAIAMFFPLLYTELHDSGPVRIGLLVMAWSPVVVARFFSSNRFQYAWVALLSIMWIVATEDKPFFVFLIPGIAIFTLASLAKKGVSLGEILNWRRIFWIFGFPAALCFSLLIYTQTNGTSYLAYLSQQSQAFGFGKFAYSLFLAGVFTLDWPFYAHRVSSLISILGEGQSGVRGQLAAHTQLFPSWHTHKGAIALGLTLLQILLVTCLFIWLGKTIMEKRAPRPRRSDSRISLGKTSKSLKELRPQESRLNDLTYPMLFGAFTFLVLGTTFAGSWAGHHFVYTSIPILVSMALAFEKWANGGMWLGIFLAILSALSLFTISLTPVQASVSKEIGVVMRTALSQVDQESIVNCSSWGCYYTYSYLNRGNIPIVFADQPSDIDKLTSLAQSRESTMMHICASCDQELVKNLYPRGTVKYIPTDTKIWQVFQVTPGRD